MGYLDRSATELHEVLEAKVADVYGSGSTLLSLDKLSGGASRETWSFDVSGDNDCKTDRTIPCRLLLSKFQEFS